MLPLIFAIAALGQQTSGIPLRVWADCSGPVPATAVLSCTLILDTKDLPTVDQVRALTLRGTAKGRMADPAGAVADMTRAIEIDPKSADAYYLRAALHLTQREFEPALADFGKAVELFPQNPATWAGRSAARLGLGDRPGALADISRSIEIAPSALSYSVRADIKRSQKDIAGAMADLDRAVALDIGSRYLGTRAGFKFDNRDYDGALADYERIITIAPGNPVGFYGRGQVESQRKNYAEALKAFERAGTLDPKFPGAVAGRLDVKMATGDLAGALADCEQLLTLDPRGLASRSRCASAKNRAGDSAGALADYSRAIEIDRSYTSAFHFRGIVRSDLHDFDGAMADWRQTITLDPAQDYVYLRIWLVDARIGDRTKATENLRAALTRRKSEKSEAWAMMLGDYLVGQVPEDDLLRAAGDGDADQVRNRQCEAYFYTGWRHMLDGDEPGARDRFTKSIDTKAFRMVELQSAAAELKFLNKK